MTVEYITVPGWKTSIVECKTFESLPQNAKDYITKIEDFLHIPGKHILLVVIIYLNGIYMDSTFNLICIYYEPLQSDGLVLAKHETLLLPECDWQNFGVWFSAR